MKKLIVSNPNDKRRERLDIAMRFAFESEPGIFLHYGERSTAENGNPFLVSYDDEKGILDDEKEVIISGVRLTENSFFFRTDKHCYIYQLDNCSPLMPNFCTSMIDDRDAGDMLDLFCPVRDDFAEYSWDFMHINFPGISTKRFVTDMLNRGDGKMILKEPGEICIRFCIELKDGSFGDIFIPKVERLIRRNSKIIAISLAWGAIALNEDLYWYDKDCSFYP